MNQLTVEECNTIWDRQYGEKKESNLTLVKWSPEIPITWIQKKLKRKNKIYSYDYTEKPKKVVNKIKQKIVEEINKQENTFLFLGQEELLFLECVKHMQQDKEVGERVNLLEFVYVEDVFYPDWDESTQSYTDEGSIEPQHIFSYFNNVEKGYLENPCYFDKGIFSMKTGLENKRVDLFKDAIYETYTHQCYSCEKHKASKSMIGMQYGYYCSHCIDEAMKNVPTGGLINYMYFHFVDQDFLDYNLDWKTIEKGKKNQRNLKKKKERLKKELNYYKVK